MILFIPLTLASHWQEFLSDQECVLAICPEQLTVAMSCSRSDRHWQILVTEVTYIFNFTVSLGASLYISVPRRISPYITVSHPTVTHHASRYLMSPQRT